jgi:hypothetical protein
VSNFKVGDRVGLLVDCGMGGKGVVIKTYDFTCDIRTDEGFVITLYDSHLLKEEKMNYKDDDVVTATAGRIRSAAGKCPQANQVLREVYPDVFKEKIESEWTLGDVVRCMVKIDGYLDTINKTGIVVKVNADRRRIHVQFVWDVAGTSDQNGVWGTHDDFTLIRRPNLNCTPKS